MRRGRGAPASSRTGGPRRAGGGGGRCSAGRAGGGGCCWASPRPGASPGGGSRGGGGGFGLCASPGKGTGGGDLLPAEPLPRSFLGVPIRVGEEVFGHLCLAEKRNGGEFSVPDLHMVKVLATEAGIAIGNARLHEATRQRERWIDGSVAVTHSLLSGDAEDALVV